MLLPQFNHIQAAELPAKLQALLTNHLAQLNAHLEENQPARWERLVPFLESLDNQLQQFWSPIQHLHAVKSTPELREAYQTCLPLLTDYHTTLGHHKKLYEAFRQLKDQATKENLNVAQKRVIDLRLRDFHLSGVDLLPPQKKRFAEIEQQLSILSAQFGEHVLDATQAWHYHVTDEKQLAGLPPHIITASALGAEKYQMQGWRLTLDAPCYLAVMKNAEDRTLRERFYHAYVTRASEFGSNQLNNLPFMQQILRLRHELAELLGFKNYAELSLATKMAEAPENVLAFLETLVTNAKPAAVRELKELTEFANQETLAPWDIAYYAEKLSQTRYHIQQETLRPYFSLEHVLNGLFQLVQQLFQLDIRPFDCNDTWHPDVRCFTMTDELHQLQGIFYLDLYVREQKREGAWMDDFCARWRKSNGELQHPVVYLSCNFSRPDQNRPTLLTHDEVITLFHEFGHGLHHLVSTIEYLDVSGIHGVPWDAVEFPSQWMENWCWEPLVLKTLARHYQTGDSLPDDLLENLLASRHFHAGLQLIRQLEYALFDFHLHLKAPDQPDYVYTIQKNICDHVAVVKPPVYNRFPHTFSHIFDGGYAAGYYSYLWAEVLASDAFELFKEKGGINATIGKQFLDRLLSQGGAEPPQVLFRAFRGRDPDSNALLRAWGLMQ